MAILPEINVITVLDFHRCCGKIHEIPTEHTKKSVIP